MQIASSFHNERRPGMIRIQIIDDDYWCAEAIKAMIFEISDEFAFEYTPEPEPIDGCDIYIIDNEFGEQDHAEQLVRRVRDSNPDAMIMICSGTMDRVRYKELINCGCDVAIEKGSVPDRDVMMVAIGRYVLTCKSKGYGVNLTRVVQDVKQILASWNKRLEQLQSRSA